VHIHYTGVVDITPGLSAILGGSPAAKTTEYGYSCMPPHGCVVEGYCADLTVVINVTFETGCERYKALETGVFVGAGRFVVDERGLSSEYKVSRVAAGPDGSGGGHEGSGTSQ
jgi:Protein of unknown function (DUF3237)